MHDLRQKLKNSPHNKRDAPDDHHPTSSEIGGTEIEQTAPTLSFYYICPFKNDFSPNEAPFFRSHSHIVSLR